MRTDLAPADLAGPWCLDTLLFPHLGRLLAGTGAGSTPPTPRAAATLTDYAPNPLREGKRVAVVNVLGFLSKGRSWYGTSTTQLRQEIRQAANDPSVSGILLAIESPGGTAAGTAELAADIQAAKKRKPVWAQVQDLAASAAYWVASQADQVWANQDSAMLGSIGTIITLMDVSAALEKDGVKVHAITTGELKAAGQFGVAVTDEQKAMLQAIVDDTQVAFDRAVTAARGLTADQLKEVRAGGIYTAARAKPLRLIDGVRPAEKTLAALYAAK